MTTKTIKKETAKKGTKSGVAAGSGAGETAGIDINSKEELKSYLLSIRDKMREQAAASIFAVSAIHHVLSLPNIYSLIDNENKEIARDIWLRLKQSGMQLKNPPLLFRPDEEDLQSTVG